MDFNVREASQKWGISERQIQKLCKECRIEGALRLSRIWMFRRMRKSLRMQGRNPKVIK